MAITFVRLKEYLEAIADSGNLDASGSGHGRFWNTDYASFMNGLVPTKRCGAQPVPIINHGDMPSSAFFLILQAPWCTAPQMPQMPRTGPFVTDPGYTVNLPDGSAVTGPTIIADIRNWLVAGAPENG